MTKNSFSIIKEFVYDKCLFDFTNFSVEKESQEYNACSFKINDLIIIGRTAKITPTKTGQFVTIWKRFENNPIQPFHISDVFDFVVINVKSEDDFGQFVFPKSVLLAKKIISSDLKDGKRGIRVYPPWDNVTSKQAERTQKWQLEYFLKIDIKKPIDIQRVKLLYSKK